MLRGMLMEGVPIRVKVKERVGSQEWLKMNHLCYVKR